MYFALFIQWLLLFHNGHATCFSLNYTFIELFRQASLSFDLMRNKPQIDVFFFINFRHFFLLVNFVLLQFFCDSFRVDWVKFVRWNDSLVESLLKSNQFSHVLVSSLKIYIIFGFGCLFWKMTGTCSTVITIILVRSFGLLLRAAWNVTSGAHNWNRVCWSR